MRLFWKNFDVADFAALLRLVSDHALNSPRRSVVPLLDFCRDPTRVCAEIGRVAQVDLGNTTDMILEYAVPVQSGRGKASFTDLVLLAPEIVVAIEARYTEPEYESVTSWLGKENSNREMALKGWLGLLNRISVRALDAADVGALPYQLIHRVASACYVDRPNRVMLYLVFGNAASHYSTHLERLSSLLGSTVSLYVASCTLNESPRFLELARRWDAGERQMASSVRAALEQGSLFSFGPLETVDSVARSA